MPDPAPLPRSAEIYGYVNGRWSMIDGFQDEAREEVIYKAKDHMRRAEVQAVRVLMSKPDGGHFVAYRNQKADGIPELEILDPKGRRLTRRPAAYRPPPPKPVEPEPEPPPPPPPRAAPAERPSPLRGLIWPAVVVVLCLAGVLVQRFDPLDLGLDDPLVTGAAVGLLLVAGLWLVRRAMQLDSALIRKAEERERARPAPLALPPPAPPMIAPPPMAEREESPPRPDRAALMPITRLMAANLERLKAAGATSAAGRPVRLAARLYVAGGCDVLAEGLGMDGAAVMEECLVLLGETREDAAAFAGCLEGFLVSPLHAALYRAGREDLAARPEGDGPGEAFVAALAPWITAWENPPAANLVVAAVAPLAPRHRPAVEAVIRAFGGEPCGRPGPHLLASFGDPLGALDVAQTLREAVQAAAEERAPGIGLAVATLPRPDQDDPGLAVAACLDVAEAAGPGGVAVSQTLRAILAGKGRRRAFAPLPDGDAEGWLLTGEGAEGEPATVA